MDFEKVLASLTEKVERRFYGKYRGKVVDNADPKKLGRLQVMVPSVLGPDEVTGWAMPCVPYGGDFNQGFFFIPEIEAGVWIEFEEGDLEFPIWMGTFWSEPDGESDVPKPNAADGTEEEIQDPPTRKIIKTVQGHTIQLEDADDEMRIIISDGNAENRITFTKTGIALENKDNKITMTDDGIVIHDKNDNAITQDTAGIVINDKNGNVLTQDMSGVVIEDANGNTVTMDALGGGIPGTPGIAINGGKKVCMEGLITWLISHTHIGNMGAPCPLNPADLAKLAPLPALPDGDILSQKVTMG